MFDSIVVLLFCYICSVLASSNPAGEVTHKFGPPFSKRNNSYVRTVKNELLDPSTIDYTSEVARLLHDIECNKTVAADDLNKFGDGIFQYYSSKAAEYYYSHQKPAAPLVNLVDPIRLPSFTAPGTPEIVFYDVNVYGFPPFQPNKAIVSETWSSDPDYGNFQSSFKAPSDVVIFAGSFSVYQKSHYFVYTTKTNLYQSKHYNVRNQLGIVQSTNVEESFSFLAEDLTHSYQSFFNHSVEVKQLIFPKFVTALESVYLPAMAAAADSLQTPQFSGPRIESSGKHHKKISDLLVKAAVQFTILKNLTTFHVRPLRFENKNDPDYNRSAAIVYDNITLEGLTNFVDYEFANLSKPVNQSLVDLSDKIKFIYPESGDKGAFLSFSIKLRLKDTTKRYRIKSLLVETALVANVAKLPPLITRNTEAFDLKTGFYISLDVDLGEEIYYFIVKHASHDLTRAIDSVVYGTKYPH